MRYLICVPLLMLAACGASHDEGNDQVTIQYNEQQAEDVASDVGNAAEEAGEAVANAAEDAAATVRNTDVDVNTEGGDASADADVNTQ